MLFISISYFRINPLIVLGATIIAAFLSLLLLGAELLFIYACLFGFVFWVAGLCIARYARENKQGPQYSTLLNGLFYMLCIETLMRRSGLFPAIVSILLDKDLSYLKEISTGELLQFRDLAVLPYAALLVMVFSAKSIPFKRLLLILLQITVLYVIAKMVNSHKFSLSLLISVSFYLISLLFYFIKKQLC